MAAVEHRAAEPVGATALLDVAEGLYQGRDPLDGVADEEPLLSVERTGELEYTLRLALPIGDSSLDLARVGDDVAFGCENLGVPRADIWPRVSAALEAVVDLHTFDPTELAATARRAGAERVGTATEELLSAFAGWPIRTVEYAVRQDALGFGWAKFAYRTWTTLMKVDAVLAAVVPQKFFYNVGVTGVKPHPAPR